MEKKAPNAKRIPPSSIDLQIAGELVLPRIGDKSWTGLFKRYESIFEMFANMEKAERILNYKMFTGLVLTSHAKKTLDRDRKRELFNMKNELYLSIANHPELRRKVALLYLTASNFRVIKYCENCTKNNTEAKLERHAWKFCASCDVDRNFYNILSMHHKFNDGSITLFLSNDMIDQIKNFTIKKRAKLDSFEEEALFNKYHYNVRNLDAIKLESALAMHKAFVSR